MSWPTRPISEVCSHVVDCVNRTAPVVDYPTPYKMLRTTNVRGGFVDTENVRYVSLETFERWTRRLLPQRGDVFLTREAPLGDVGRLTSDDQVFLGQRLFHYRADPEKMDAKFLAYALQSSAVQGWIRGVGMGATVEHARVGDFHKIPLPVPPREVQTKIGDILSAYDDLIENNERRIALLEKAARMLYREWFIDFRFPGHEHAKIVEGLPEGWGRKPIIALAEVFRGKSYSSEELVDEGGQPFVNLKCIQRFGGFRVSGLKGFRGEHKPHHLLVPGNIVIAVTDMTREAMVVAQAARIPKTVGAEAIYSMDLVKIVPKEDVGLTWLYGLLRFSRFSSEVRQEATGATVLHLKPKHIENWVATVPTAMLRSLFAEQYGSILDQIDNLELQGEKLIQARDLLLPRLMNGEIAV